MYKHIDIMEGFREIDEGGTRIIGGIKNKMVLQTKSIKLTMLQMRFSQKQSTTFEDWELCNDLVESNLEVPRNQWS